MSEATVGALENYVSLEINRVGLGCFPEIK